jgi:hypothetical protein
MISKRMAAVMFASATIFLGAQDNQPLFTLLAGKDQFQGHIEHSHRKLYAPGYEPTGIRFLIQDSGAGVEMSVDGISAITILQKQFEAGPCEHQHTVTLFLREETTLRGCFAPDEKVTFVSGSVTFPLDFPSSDVKVMKSLDPSSNAKPVVQGLGQMLGGSQSEASDTTEELRELRLPKVLVQKSVHHGTRIAHVDLKGGNAWGIYNMTVADLVAYVYAETTPIKFVAHLSSHQHVGLGDIPSGKYDITVVGKNTTGQETIVGSFAQDISPNHSYMTLLQNNQNADPTQEFPAKQIAPITTIDPVQQEIERIRNGPHEAIPLAQAAPSALGGQTGMDVKNGTSCTLSVFVSGLTSQKIQLAPGGSQSLPLTPGNYELAASVSCPNVIPFYGTQTLAANTKYSENFYIGVK